MTAIHPLPEPGSVEAFVVNALEVAALSVLLHRTRELVERPSAVTAAEQFLAWIEACAAWCGGGPRASGHDLTRDDLVVAMRRVRDPGLDAVHVDRAVLRAAFPMPRRS